MATARIARLVKALRLSSPIECSRIASFARYASSQSSHSPDSTPPNPPENEKASEVGYSRKPQKTKGTQAAAKSNENVKSDSKSVKPKEENAKSGVPTGENAQESAKKRPKVAAVDPLIATNAALKTDESSAPSAESLLNVSYAKPEPEGLEDVGYAPKRRVMPLPEDRPATEEPEEPETPTEDGATATRKVFKRVFTAPEYDFNLPLPRIIKQESKKKKEPVSLSEAIQLVKKSAHCKFVETIEAHIQLGVDPKRSDQIVRGAVTLPHGSGKVVKVAVFADGPAAEEALAAGADVVGTDDLVEKVFASGGKLDFEKCIATPSVMPKLGKVARILGPRGMMPNPKMGTVTLKVGDAVRAAKQGRVDFRADKTAIIHAGLGKVNFTDEALYENIAAFSAAVLAAKPVGFKKSSRYGGFFNKFYLSCTMGIGVPVTIQSVAAASDSYIKNVEAAAQGA